MCLVFRELMMIQNSAKLRENFKYNVKNKRKTRDRNMQEIVVATNQIGI